VGTVPVPVPAPAGRLFDNLISLPTPEEMEEEESVSECAAVCGVSVPTSVVGTVKLTGTDTDTGTAVVSSLTPSEEEGVGRDGPHAAVVGTTPHTGAETDTDSGTGTLAEADEGGTGLLDVEADCPFLSFSALGDVP
jgi:hypothetical protein